MGLLFCFISGFVLVFKVLFFEFFIFKFKFFKLFLGNKKFLLVLDVFIFLIFSFSLVGFNLRLLENCSLLLNLFILVNILFVFVKVKFCLKLFNFLDIGFIIVFLEIFFRLIFVFFS